MSIIPTKKKTIKTPTELINFVDQIDAIFGDFELDYLPFVKWVENKEGNVEVDITFAQDKPIEYTNKWGRIQWKMEVTQDNEARILSGGKRLWSTFKSLLLKLNCLPTHLPVTTVYRIGDGFSTMYTFVVNASKQTKIPK